MHADVKPARELAQWDLITTIALMVVLIVLTAVGAFGGFLVNFSAAGCAATLTDACSRQVANAASVGTYGPPVIAFVVIVVTIASLAARRTSWWIPAVGGALVAVPYVIAVAMVANLT